MAINKENTVAVTIYFPRDVLTAARMAAAKTYRKLSPWVVWACMDALALNRVRWGERKGGD